MLFRIVAVLTFMSALSGLLRVLFLSRRRGRAPVSDPKLLQKKRNQRMRWSILFSLSTFAFLFLITGYATPVETMLALALCLAVIYPLTFIKGELRLVGRETRTLAVARDAATGERLGLVVGQLKEPQSGRIKSYKIKSEEGALIEKTVEAVVVEFQ